MPVIAVTTFGISQEARPLVIHLIAMSSRPVTLLELFDSLKTSQYIQLTAVTILYYDYLTTFSDTFDFVWGKELNLTTAIFLVTRYSPLIESVLLMIQQFSAHISPNACLDLVYIGAWLYIVGIAASHILLILRTYILCGKNKTMAVALLALLAPVSIGGGYFTQKFLLSVRFAPNPIFPGCLAAKASNILWVVSVFAIFYELGIMFVTWFKVIHQNKHIGSSLIRTLTWDALSFYLYMLVTSIATLVSLTVAPGEISFSLIFLHRFVRAAISCRFLVRVRRVSDSNHGLSNFIEPPTISLARSRLQGGNPDLGTIELEAIQVRSQLKPDLRMDALPVIDMSSRQSWENMRTF